MSAAAPLCIKPGQRPRLIYRVYYRRKRGTGQGKGGTDQRKGFTEADYARLLYASRTRNRVRAPRAPVLDNLNSHVSAAMTELIAARGLADRLPAPAVRARAQPGRARRRHPK